MSSVRPNRVADQMRTELAQLMHDELKDPRIGFASVVKIEVAPDLRVAKVYISVLGDAEAKKNTLKGLVSASGFLRGEIGNRLRLRYAPELRFLLDESIEHGAHIAALLHQVHKESEGGPKGE